MLMPHVFASGTDALAWVLGRFCAEVPGMDPVVGFVVVFTVGDVCEKNHC